jgi:hypothetical protein
VEEGDFGGQVQFSRHLRSVRGLYMVSFLYVALPCRACANAPLNRAVRGRAEAQGPRFSECSSDSAPSGNAVHYGSLLGPAVNEPGGWRAIAQDCQRWLELTNSKPPRPHLRAPAGGTTAPASRSSFCTGKRTSPLRPPTRQRSGLRGRPTNRRNLHLLTCLSCLAFA